MSGGDGGIEKLLEALAAAARPEDRPAVAEDRYAAILIFSA